MNKLSLIFCLFLTLGLNAQTGILSGRVIDESTLPLTGATVVIDAVRGTSTDVNGFLCNQ